MSAYEEVRKVLNELSGQERLITIPKTYVEITGDLAESLVLNQIVFYADKSKRTDGFFYKSYKDWAAETSLTERQVRHATKKLKEKELIETKLLKANGAPTVHYKLRFDILVKWILTKGKNGFLHNVSIDSDKVSESLTYEYTDDLITDDIHTDIPAGARAQNQNSEKQKENEKPENQKEKNPSDVINAFLESFGKMPNGIQLDHITGFLDVDEMEPEVLIAVIEKAALGGKPFNYVTAALAGLCRDGIKTMAAYTENEHQRRRQHDRAKAKTHQNNGRRTGSAATAEQLPGFVNRTFDDVDISKYTKKG